jgi:hypothetical protein
VLNEDIYYHQNIDSDSENSVSYNEESTISEEYSDDDEDASDGEEPYKRGWTRRMARERESQSNLY